MNEGLILAFYLNMHSFIKKCFDIEFNEFFNLISDLIDCLSLC